MGAYNLLGIAYAKLCRTEEALQQFNWAIDHSPVRSSATYSNATQALLIWGRFDEAKKMVDQWRQNGTLTPFQIMLRYRIASLKKITPPWNNLRAKRPRMISPGFIYKC